MRSHNGVTVEEAIQHGDARSGYACGNLTEMKAACAKWLLKHQKTTPENMRAQFLKEIKERKKS